MTDELKRYENFREQVGGVYKRAQDKLISKDFTFYEILLAFIDLKELLLKVNGDGRIDGMFMGAVLSTHVKYVKGIIKAQRN